MEELSRGHLYGRPRSAMKLVKFDKESWLIDSRLMRFLA